MARSDSRSADRFATSCHFCARGRPLDLLQSHAAPRGRPARDLSPPLSEPDAFAPAAGPPSGLHRLVFARPLLFDEHELRRLAPAVVFSRSLIGATYAGGEPKIWDVIHSGPQWLQSVRGGRATDQTIPPVLIVAATGPGRLLVTAGAVTLAERRARSDLRVAHTLYATKRRDMLSSARPRRITGIAGLLFVISSFVAPAINVQPSWASPPKD